MCWEIIMTKGVLRIGRVVLAGAFFACCFGQATVPSVPPGKMQLTVRDEGGTPLAGATVRVARSESYGAEEEMTVQTDDSGKAEITRSMGAERRVWEERVTVEKAGSTPRE